MKLLDQCKTLDELEQFIGDIAADVFESYKLSGYGRCINNIIEAMPTKYLSVNPDVEEVRAHIAGVVKDHIMKAHKEVPADRFDEKRAN